MATFSRTAEWSADTPAAEVRRRVLGALRARGAKVIADGDGRIEARAGSSWLARLDVSLVPQRWLPLKIVVTVVPIDDIAQVAVTVEDRLGVGATGTGTRYDELFDATIDGIREATTS
jgi:hypothetical protein